MDFISKLIYSYVSCIFLPRIEVQSDTKIVPNSCCKCCRGYDIHWAGIHISRYNQTIWTLHATGIASNECAILEHNLVGAIVIGFEEEELVLMARIQCSGSVFLYWKVDGLDTVGWRICSGHWSGQQFCTPETRLHVGAGRREDGFVAENVSTAHLHIRENQTLLWLRRLWYRWHRTCNIFRILIFRGSRYLQVTCWQLETVGCYSTLSLFGFFRIDCLPY